MIKQRRPIMVLILISVPILLGCALTTNLSTPTLALIDTPGPIDPTTAPTQQGMTEEPTPTSTAIPEPKPVQVLPDPQNYQWALVADGFQRPVDLSHVGDERLFIVEQIGRIRILRNGQILEQPFLDIQDRVNDQANEQGLLGLAFHPDYTSNGWFYLNYTDVTGSTVIARYQMTDNPDIADPSTEEVLLKIEQPFGNHNGGGMEFGPDGYLYIGTGDGGSANDPLNNGQSTNTLLGKILRLDVDHGLPYTIPADNPFIDEEGRSEIWALGLRNPWRFSFDPRTGDLYIGDVGQGRWEEVNYQPNSAEGGWNFGWNLREGAHPFAAEIEEGLIDPIAEYAHDLGCSITGGEVIRNTRLPEWEGVYLFGDYCTGYIWGLVQQESGNWIQELLFETDSRISSFGRGYSGEVYFLDLGGEIYQLATNP